MDRIAAGEIGGRRPQRIVGCGDENFISVVEQSLQCNLNEFADAVAQPHVVDVGDIDSVRLVVLHDRGTGRDDSLRIGIALRIGQVANDIDEDFGRGLETERGRVADVQFHDAVTEVFKTTGLFEHGSTNVVEDVGQLVRLLEFPARCHRVSLAETAADSTGF